jgi:hypothetical protein
VSALWITWHLFIPVNNARAPPSPTKQGSLLSGADLRWRAAEPATPACAALLARARHAAFSLDAVQQPPPADAGAERHSHSAELGQQQAAPTCGVAAAGGSVVPLRTFIVYGGVSTAGDGAWLGDLVLVTLWREGRGAAKRGPAREEGHRCKAKCILAGAERGRGGGAAFRYRCETLEQLPGGCGHQATDLGESAVIATSANAASSGGVDRSSAGETSALVGPCQRRDFAACAAGPARFLLHGGFLGAAGGEEASDIWICDLERCGPSACPGTPQGEAWRARWRPGRGGSVDGAAAAAAQAPMGRSHHSLCYCGASRRAVLFGGYRSGAGCLNDLWVWSPDDSRWWQPGAAGARITCLLSTDSALTVVSHCAAHCVAKGGAGASRAPVGACGRKRVKHRAPQKQRK